MFNGGPIARGINCNKKMDVEERIYIFCRGRQNANFSNGLAVNKFTNEYNAKPFRSAEIYRAANDPSGYIYFYDTPDAEKAIVIGTGKAVNTGLRRYLVVEAIKRAAAPAGADTTLYVKFSNTTDIEDDGNLFGFILGPEMKKYYIDLQAEGVNAFKYITLINGLFNASFPAAVRRIYFTDNKEENAINALFNAGNDPQVEWEGWTGPSGRSNPGTIETDYINLQEYDSYVITKDKINISGKNKVGIILDCTEASGQQGYDNYLQVWFYNAKTFATGYAGNAEKYGITAGTNQTLYINIKNAGSNQFSANAILPVDGEYYVGVNTGTYTKPKIQKIWLE